MPGKAILVLATTTHQHGKKYRSRTGLMASILGAAASVPEGELSTRIMYKVNTSQYDLKEYLRDLMDYDLLKHDSQSRRYKVTAKGFRFLELYSRMKEELRDLE